MSIIQGNAHTSTGGYQIERSLRFNSVDSAYLTRTPATASGQNQWTFSCWFKRVSPGATQYFIGGNTTTSGARNEFNTAIDGNNNLTVWAFTNASGYYFNRFSSNVYRDVSAWYHLVIQFDPDNGTSANRVIAYINNVQVTWGSSADSGAAGSIGSSGYRSVNNTFRNDIGGGYQTGGAPIYFSNTYMTEIHMVSGSIIAHTEFGEIDSNTGVWKPKKYGGSYGTNGFYLKFADNSGTTATTLGKDSSGNGNNWTPNNFSVGLASSKVLVIDDATKAGSVTQSMTIVGSGTVNLTAFGGCGNISGSVFTGIGALNGLISDWQTHTVYKNGSSLFTVTGGAVNNNSGTQTATQSRSAQTVTQNNVAVSNGDVISIAFGANNAVTAYYGYPGGAPSLTVTANSGVSISDYSATDSFVDSPTNYGTDTGVGGEVRGNYATWNPLDRTAATYTNGNLEVSSTSSAAPYNMTTTIQLPTSGKWYCEVTALKGANSPLIGIGNNRPTDQVIGYRSNATYISAGVTGVSSSGTPATWTTGDIIGIAYDADAGTLSFYKNGSAQSGGFTSIPATGYCVTVRADSASGDGGTLNAGQRPFAYTAPSGFKALCTQNLPTPTIGATSTTQANDYFNPVLYSGNGSNQSITSVGFQPDFVWVKSRSAAQNHGLYDAVRGVGKALQSNLTTAESNYFPYGVQSFDSSGFTVADDASSSYAVNGSTGSPTYVAWNWKANGAGSSNTAGTITSTVSANTTSGFSIVSFNSGAAGDRTVGHGLGVTPSVVIMKSRQDSSYNWAVYHSSVTDTTSKFLRLNTSDSVITYATVWGAALPTSTVFGITSGNGSGGIFNNTNCIAYCFAAVAGYSSFGSYTGNGSTDGPFVYTGFRPRWIMIKRTDSTGNWQIQDTARTPYNWTCAALFADLSAAENTSEAEATYGRDYLSNGFKIRASHTSHNTNGATYIYMAFAESPFKYSLAR